MHHNEKREPLQVHVRPYTEHLFFFFLCQPKGTSMLGLLWYILQSLLTLLGIVIVGVIVVVIIGALIEYLIDQVRKNKEKTE